jgi:hypothetical protein
MGGRVTFLVMGLFRRRFSDLVERQLDLFVADHRSEIADLVQALDEHHRASSDDAQEAYGDYQDRVDWAAQDLLALRDAYAATLDVDTAAVYVRAFSRGVHRRFPALGNAVDTEDVD